MIMKASNPRMDVLSRARFPKERLLRLVLIDGVYLPDKEGKIPGRGVYLLKDKAAVEAGRKRLEKSLHHPFGEEEFLAILEALA